MKTINDIRKYAGVSRPEFSRKYGIPVRTLENWEAETRKCPGYLINLLSRAVLEDFKKYLVEFAFAENFTAVDEWDTMDGLDEMTSENAEAAAKEAARTDGLENALFRVYRLVQDEFGEMEKSGDPEYFYFGD